MMDRALRRAMTRSHVPKAFGAIVNIERRSARSTATEALRIGFRGRDLGAANEGSGLVDDQARRFDIAVDRAARPQFATLAGGNVALDRAVHDNGLGSDLAFDLRMLADGQPSVGIDLAFDRAVNVQLFLKFYRAFDGDSARQDSAGSRQICGAV